MKTVEQLEGLEVHVIGTLIRHPDSFKEIRAILRPDMFATDSGRIIAGKVWALMLSGTFSGTLLAAELSEVEKGMCNKAAQFAEDKDVNGLIQAASILCADWEDRVYYQGIEKIIFKRNSHDSWRDADAVMNEAKRDIMNASAGKAVSPEMAIDAVMDDMWAGLTGRKLYSGIPTGFADLDDLTGGWQPKQQIVVGGRPGMGKTRYAVQSCYECAKSGRAAAFISLEIDKGMIYRYLLSYMTRIPVGKMKTYNLNKHEADTIGDAAEMLKAMPIFVIDDVYSLQDALFVGQELAEQKDVGLIVVDYIQLITSGQKGKTTNDEVATISRELKQLARRTNSTTMVLSQISRKATDRAGGVPTLADLRDSGAIEADADAVIFPFRVEEPTEDNPTRIIVAKQRDGEIGDIMANWESPGFYYPISSTPFDPSLNGKAVPILEDTPF